jgi:uncharacterized protein
VHGSADQQVPPAHAALLHAARPDARLLMVDGMDHLLAVGSDAARGASEVATAISGLAVELQRNTAA